MNLNINPIKQDLAVQLKTLRQEKNISLEDLSQALNLRLKWLTRLENAKAHIDWYFLLKLAHFYNKKIKIRFE